MPVLSLLLINTWFKDITTNQKNLHNFETRLADDQTRTDLQMQRERRKQVTSDDRTTFLKSRPANRSAGFIHLREHVLCISNDVMEVGHWPMFCHAFQIIFSLLFMFNLNQLHDNLGEIQF